MTADHTKGPWRVRVGRHHDPDQCDLTICGDIFLLADVTGPNYSHCEPNAKLMAAAPTMADAIKGLIGLCQLLRNRDDLPLDVRYALAHNPRVVAGYEALTTAGFEGFQPVEYDARDVVMK